MVPGGDSPQGSLDRFAAEVVGLGPDRDESDTLAALFRKLLDDDFLPDPLTHQAMMALAGQPVGPDSLLAEEAARTDERRLRLEVEQYAAGFFDEPVVSRVERYRRLGQACAHHPRLIERLRVLRPGLMIDRSVIADPSPVVERLLDDLFCLFPLRPGPRAIETRERAERFRSDPELTDAKRSRALKDLAKRHPDVVALLNDYPARLVKVRRRTSADRLLLKVVERLAEPRELISKRYLLFVVILLSGIFRLLNHQESSSKSPTFMPANLQTPERRPTPITNPVRWENATISRQIREDLKGPIRRELSRIGKNPDEVQLGKIVAGLPVEQLPQVGGMVTILFGGHWTEPVRNRFIASLKFVLRGTGLGISESELDDLAPRCFPKATPRGSP